MMQACWSPIATERPDFNSIDAEMDELMHTYNTMSESSAMGDVPLDSFDSLSLLMKKK